MKRADLSVPVISPLSEEDRPLWSVMIPTYNCADQAGETLASVLCQAPDAERMEIVVVDDASTDHIASIVEQYAGRVRLHCQPYNLGVPVNLTEAIRLSRGRLVHLLHGDDLVRPGFYAAMEAAFEDEDVGAAYCRYAYIDENGRQTGLGPLEQEASGRLQDALRRLSTEQRIMTPSICVRRDVYEELGGFHPSLHCAEDWEMWVRIAQHYPVAYVTDVLACYRMQTNSNTGRSQRIGRDVKYNGIAIDLIYEHLPADIADEVTSIARRTYARSALATAYHCAQRGDVRAAIAQFGAALYLDKSLATLVSGARALARIGYSLLKPRHRA